MSTLVDANVLIDLVQDDPVWAEWSAEQLAIAGMAGPVLIGDLAYAEIAPSFATQLELEAFLRDTRLEHIPILPNALFLAGKIHSDYRRAGGSRLSILPDFFIGAQAATLGLPLLTRDVRRYRSYFPTVRLIAPPA